LTVEEVIRYTIKTVSEANVPIDVKLILFRGLSLFITEQENIPDVVKDILLSDIVSAMIKLYRQAKREQQELEKYRIATGNGFPLKWPSGHITS